MFNPGKVNVTGVDVVGRMTNAEKYRNIQDLGPHDPAFSQAHTSMGIARQPNLPLSPNKNERIR